MKESHRARNWHLPLIAVIILAIAFGVYVWLNVPRSTLPHF